MFITSINQKAAPEAARSTTTPAADALSGQFMQLLLAQLRNQNPLDPVSNKDMLGQMAQINSLQELQKMNTALQGMAKGNRLSEAAGLLGKTVQAKAENGEARAGVVTGITVEDDQVKLWLGREPVMLTDVTAVSAPEKGVAI